jgi:hypothetical protein
MKTIKLIICLIAFGFGSFQTLLGAPENIDPVGVWEGRWDKEWLVRFTITKMDNGKYKVVYEHEENVGGSLSKTSGELPAMKNGVITYGKIDIEFKNGKEAIAKGNFVTPRTADLKKVETKTASEADTGTKPPATPKPNKPE